MKEKKIFAMTSQGAEVRTDGGDSSNFVAQNWRDAHNIDCWLGSEARNDKS